MELDWLSFFLALTPGSAIFQLCTLGKLPSLAVPHFLDIYNVSAWHLVSAQKKSVVTLRHKQLGENGPLQINLCIHVICSKGQEALLLS